MLRELLLEALQQAYKKSAQCDASTREMPRARSEAWVDELGKAFFQRYKPYNKLRVFWKQNSENRKEFKLNELMHDVTVAETVLTESAVRGAQLPVICRAIWQVESEMARDSREAIYDFNKLVLGSATRKLFIGPLVSRRKHFRDALLPAAAYCSGEVYAAFIPHPAEWEDVAPTVELWQFVNRVWVACDDDWLL